MKFLQKKWAVGLLIAAIGGGSLLAAPGRLDGTAQGAVGDAEMMHQSDDLKAQVDGDARHVLHLREIARRQKDIIKLTCINDKMVELKAQANIFDDANRELRVLLGGGTGDRAGSFANLTAAAGAVHKVRVDADACVGEPELVGESGNDVTHPPFPDDPTIGDPFGGIVEPPGYASPFN